MSSRKKEKNDFNSILVCIAIFVIGYVFLEKLSDLSIPPGQSFYVVIGCLMMAAGLVKLYLIIKNRFFSKKKKKTKMVFMNDKNHKKNIEI